MPKKEEKDVIREKKQISTEKLRRVRIRSALAEPWALKNEEMGINFQSSIMVYWIEH